MGKPLTLGAALSALATESECDGERIVYLCRVIAGGYAKRLPANVLHADILQAALLGAFDAIRRHPDRGGREFEAYHRRRIVGSIQDELRAQDFAPRRTRQGNRTFRVFGFDDVAADWEERFAGEGADPEELAISRLDAQKALDAPLNVIDRRVFTRHFIHGKKQDDVALEEGTSPARISQRESRAIRVMRSHLTGEPGDDIPLATRHELFATRAVRLRPGSAGT
jgi:RNA polymerase sigma factor (sigma-70 family)